MTQAQNAWLDEQVAGATVTLENGAYVARWNDPDHGCWESDPATTDAGARANLKAAFAELIDDCGPTANISDFADAYLDEYGIDLESNGEYEMYCVLDTGQVKGKQKQTQALARTVAKWLITFLLEAARNLQGPIVIKTEDPEYPCNVTGSSSSPTS